ncbi:hypothetical protein NC653_000793 [Populus alba x Populus x berolinensis]|uniref:Uncharacterized protein n=1 Tax=Populus alba x Populus x berolinensis TaxID=444605 RepID=A0AAD6RJV4_9ROSI|nr:hypothetical protein NC653_000793 [Populus alba x Populus x berolinensis]
MKTHYKALNLGRELSTLKWIRTFQST